MTVDLQHGHGRIEDHRFLTGSGTFTEDLPAGDALACAVLRSPHAHADILSIETAEAASLPGVVGVYTVADLHADGIGDLVCAASFAATEPLVRVPRPALADGRVRFAGDPVAFVVAESHAVALDALERIAVEYADLPAVTEAEAALSDGAPTVWDMAPGNRAYAFEKGDADAVARAMAGAAHVVELDIVNQRVSAAPIEPRVAIGSHDAAEDRLVLTLTGQGVHGIRNQMAGPVFGLDDPTKLVVRAPDVGGGFGAKNFVYPEHVLVLWAARKLGRDVRFVADRGEDLVGGLHGRDINATARLALDADGRFLALDARLTANMGAYLSGGGPGASTNSASTALGGMYDIPALHIATVGALTNTAPVDAYRGAGKPEANFITERLIEVAARRLGIDPVELRQRNLIRQFPHTTGLGQPLDTGNLPTAVPRLMTVADRDGFARRRTGSEARGRLRGFGMGCFMETSRGGPSEWASVTFPAAGGVELRVGTESNGQGHETTFSRLLAGRLGLTLDDIRYVQADTSETASGGGHGGARSLYMGGTAMWRAMDAALEKAIPVAARLLQAEPGEVSVEAGVFAASEGGQTVRLLDVAAAARDAGTPLDSDGRLDEAPFTYPNGAHAAEVEVDPETGRVDLVRYASVDDFGTVIDPVLIEGQMHGGVVQGIGQALMEHLAYDEESGQCLAGSFMDYAMPAAARMPMFDLTFEGVPTAVNPLGVKGSGQAGCMAAPQAVVNAVLDALVPMGIEHVDMPLTPERVWRAVRAAQGARTA